MDAAWVAASIATIGLGWYSIFGAVTIALVASVVGYLATRQATSIRRTRFLAVPRPLDIDQAPPVEVVHVEQLIDGDRTPAWMSSPTTSCTVALR